MDRTTGYAADDFRKMDPWRIMRIMSEFVAGFEAMAQIENGVSVFGSARTPETDRYYKMAVDLGKKLTLDGYTVITGGGPGIMEAANRGASEAKKNTSVGLNIDLPYEQKPNPYIGKLVSFHYFFCRKVMFCKYSKAIAVFPGGFGTLDELFEHLTLVQTMKINPMPVILVGKSFWGGMLDWIKRELLERENYISPEDMHLFEIVDTPDEALGIIKSRVVVTTVNGNNGNGQTSTR